MVFAALRGESFSVHVLFPAAWLGFADLVCNKRTGNTSTHLLYSRGIFLTSQDSSGRNHTGMFAAFQIIFVLLLVCVAKKKLKKVIFLCLLGSTFKPLNLVNKPEKSKKRNRRTTIMGIPNQVQKELGISKHYPRLAVVMCPLG